MNTRGVDPLLLRAWLTARSIARGSPAPVLDHGGLRVDTGSEAEVARWVFAGTEPGLQELARSIAEPRRFLKLCGEAAELEAALPTGWTIHAPGYFMRSGGEAAAARLPDGYAVEVVRTGEVSEARVTRGGVLTARGYAVETSDVFIYDRIATEPDHRRQGLGRAVMTSLRSAKRRPGTPELLVATGDGRALYSTLGWEMVSAYSTASIVAP